MNQSDFYTANLKQTHHVITKFTPDNIGAIVEWLGEDFIALTNWGKITITAPDGRDYNISKNYDPESYIQKYTDNFILTIRNNDQIMLVSMGEWIVKTDRRYEVYARIEDIEKLYELNFPADSM